MQRIVVRVRYAVLYSCTDWQKRQSTNRVTGPHPICIVGKYSTGTLYCTYGTVYEYCTQRSRSASVMWEITAAIARGLSLLGAILIPSLFSSVENDDSVKCLILRLDSNTSED